MTSSIFKKPDMRYVDMAIAVDKEIYEPNADHDRIFTMMWHLAYMLACKQRYFNSKEEYEEFASILAYSTYQRMTNPEIAGDPKTRIKSCLNYMKSIMYFRKVAYEAQRHQEIMGTDFDTEWDSATYVEKCRDAIETSNRDVLIDGVIDTFKELPSMIKANIPKAFKSDKVLYGNIYTSCLLSMISKVTLPQQCREYLDNKLETSPNFNEVKYYSKHLKDDIILWRLQPSFENIVRVTINKTNKQLIDTIRDLSNDIKISNEELSGIMSSTFVSNGRNSNETVN